MTTNFVQPFGMSYDKPFDIFKGPKCERCEQEIPLGEKIVKDRKTIHKSCYKCAICDLSLEHGTCGLDNGLCRYGPIWLCREHLLLPPHEKEQMIQQRGFQQRCGPRK